MIAAKIIFWYKAIILDKPAGGLRIPFFWPMRAQQSNQTDPHRPITWFKICWERGGAAAAERTKWLIGLSAHAGAKNVGLLLGDIHKLSYQVSSGYSLITSLSKHDLYHTPLRTYIFWSGRVTDSQVLSGLLVCVLPFVSCWGQRLEENLSKLFYLIRNKCGDTRKLNMFSPLFNYFQITKSQQRQ